ncbi:MAG: hypothetical protein RL708_1069 [Bacteroidota bacterium]|jgi:predicted ABC-type ATPase
MPTLYILAGCNGAGKTTAAQILLPEIFHCNEFVNADLIAKGLSPFNADSVAIQAGRMMLDRMDLLVSQNKNFVIETTLATKSYMSFIKEIKLKGYEIVLLFLWLNSYHLAISRVEKRVSMGGHDIPLDVIERRYKRGIRNFIKLYLPISDRWSAFDNSFINPNPIAEGILNIEQNIINFETWNQLNKIANS